jgi:hypothetical protein
MTVHKYAWLRFDGDAGIIVSLSHNGTLTVVRRAPRLSQGAFVHITAGEAPDQTVPQVRDNTAWRYNDFGRVTTRRRRRCCNKTSIVERHEVVRFAPQQATSGPCTDHVTDWD